MGTHYDTLGVASSASNEEIRKAYLRRARALHPDRQLGRSPAEATRAEEAMRQVNLAWGVLSDRAKKAEYDKRVGVQRSNQKPPRAASGRPASNPPPRRPAASTSGPSASKARQPNSSTPAPKDGEGSASVLASFPVLILLGLLLGIVIVTAFANRGPSDNRPVIPVSSTELGVGDCFVFEGSTPRVRACTSGAADGQVVDALPDSANCPEGSQFMRDPSSEFFLCWVRMIPGSVNTVGN